MLAILHKPLTRGAMPPIEKCVGHTFKLLDIV